MRFANPLQFVYHIYFLPELIHNLISLGNAYTPDPKWLQTAQSLLPSLQHIPQDPLYIVNPVSNTSAFLRWNMEPGLSMDQFYNKTWVKGDSFIIDFGGHRSGYFRYSLLQK